MKFLLALLVLVLIVTEVDARRRRRNRRVRRAEPARRVARPVVARRVVVNRRVARAEPNRRVRRGRGRRRGGFFRRAARRVRRAFRRIFRRGRRNRRVVRRRVNRRVRRVNRRVRRVVRRNRRVVRVAVNARVSVVRSIPQLPHRCHAQMTAVNACQRRCRGRGRRGRRRRNRCRRAVAACQRIARIALSRCLVPRPVGTAPPPVTAPPHRCQAQINVVNNCFRRCFGNAKCRADRFTCKVAADTALVACLRPVTVPPPTTAAPVFTIPPRPARGRCWRQVRCLARCRSGRCRHRARRALRRCQGIVRPSPVAVSVAPAPHVCDRYRIRLTRCNTHRCRVAARCRYNRCHCRGGLHRLRIVLRRVHRRASKCSEVDRTCVNTTYARACALRRRIVALRTRCRRLSTKRCRVAVRVRKHPCRAGRGRRYIARLRVRRSSLLARVRRCADEDANCAARLLRQVLGVNRHIRVRARLCSIRLPKVIRRSIRRCKRSVKSAAATVCGHHVYSHLWRDAYACDPIRIHFKRWVNFWNCKRQVVFREHKRCDPMDLSCMRFAFVQLMHISRRLAAGRNDAAEKLRVCDECAPIKLQFRRWLRRMRAKRARAHARILRCRNYDVECQNRNVATIRRIQNAIIHRRARVGDVHRDCAARGGTHGGFMSTAYTTEATTTAAPLTPSPYQQPTVERSLGSSASALTVSVALLALVAFLL